MVYVVSPCVTNMSLQEVYRQRYVQTQKDKAL
jgi:hypothetical protein